MDFLLVVVALACLFVLWCNLTKSGRNWWRKELEESEKKQWEALLKRNREQAERERSRSRMQDDQILEQEEAFRMEDNQVRERLFLQYAFSMLAKMAKADGRVSADEVKTAEKLFDRYDFAASRRSFCSRVFNEAKDSSRTIFWYAECFFKLCPDESTRLFLYDLLWDVACADGCLHPEEKHILEELCRHLRLAESCFNDNYWRRRKAFSEGTKRTSETFHEGFSSNAKMTDDHFYRSGRSSLFEAYEVLGCEPTATDEDARAAYRASAKKWHPDRLHQNGVPQEMISKAKEMMAQINAAWNDIKRARGL